MAVTIENISNLQHQSCYVSGRPQIISDHSLSRQIWINKFVKDC